MEREESEGGKKDVDVILSLQLSRRGVASKVDMRFRFELASWLGVAMK
jgi:hypothetical protein